MKFDFNFDVTKVVIYKVTNLINGMTYVGETNNPIIRWGQHCVNTNPLGLDIQKYGLQNFNFEILEELEDDPQIVAGREGYHLKRVPVELRYNTQTPGRKLSAMNDIEFETIILEALDRTEMRPERSGSFKREEMLKILDTLNSDFQIRESYIYIKKRMLELGILKEHIITGVRLLKRLK